MLNTLTTIIGLFLLPTPVQASTTPAVVPTVLTIQDKILATFNDPRMVHIAHCESNFRQLVNGKPLMSPTSDVGVLQINQIHWKEAKDLGLDIFNSEDDNLIMAKRIYDKAGIKSWMALYSDCYKKLTLRDV